MPAEPNYRHRAYAEALHILKMGCTACAYVEKPVGVRNGLRDHHG